MRLPLQTMKPLMSKPSFSNPILWNYADLSNLLTLEQCGSHHFRSRLHDPNLNNRAFGGQILGQALAAALNTVEDRPSTALQLLFLQGGNIDAPIDFHVAPLQDGKRFSSRHIRATQGARIICDAHASFQHEAEGVNYNDPLREEIPEPETLQTMSQLAARYATASNAHNWRLYEKPCLSFCLIDHEKHLFETGTQPRVKFWLKLKNTLPESTGVHYAALAYLSDFWLASSSLTQHIPMAAMQRTLYASSLNHGIWFHGPCRADDWLLFISESAQTYQGRGLSTARVYDRSRRHVATISQECLISPMQ